MIKAVKDRENRNNANHPTRSEAMDTDDLFLYSSISSLFPPAEPWWWECPPPDDAALFLSSDGVVFDFDSSFRNRSISALCVLMVSFNSERAEDDSRLLMMLLLLRNSVLDNDGFLMNASCDVDSRWLLLGIAEAAGIIITFSVRSDAAMR